MSGRCSSTPLPAANQLSQSSWIEPRSLASPVKMARSGASAAPACITWPQVAALPRESPATRMRTGRPSPGAVVKVASARHVRAGADAIMIRRAGGEAAQVHLMNAHRRRIVAGEIGRIGEPEALGLVAVAGVGAPLERRAARADVGRPRDADGRLRIADVGEVHVARIGHGTDGAVVLDRRGRFVRRRDGERAAVDGDFAAGGQRQRRGVGPPQPATSASRRKLLAHTPWYHEIPARLKRGAPRRAPPSTRSPGPVLPPKQPQSTLMPARTTWTMATVNMTSRPIAASDAARRQRNGATKSAAPTTSSVAGSVTASHGASCGKKR